jgi:hypothetical protein
VFWWRAGWPVCARWQLQCSVGSDVKWPAQRGGDLCIAAGLLADFGEPQFGKAVPQQYYSVVWC